MKVKFPSDIDDLKRFKDHVIKAQSSWNEYEGTVIISQAIEMCNTDACIISIYRANSNAYRNGLIAILNSVKIKRDEGGHLYTELV